MTINILQLAAGKGSRFANYTTTPKPFLPLITNPMFRVGIDSLKLKLHDVRYHFLFQEDHINEHDPEKYITDLDAKLYTINYYTDGAASSAAHVIAKSEYINEPWLIVDCDFVLDYNVETFLEQSKNNSVVFVEEKPWIISSSYACVDSNMNVYGVAEKQPISNFRNTGQYHWLTGNLFMEAYNFYKSNNFVANGEFYIAPLYNYAIYKNNNVKAMLVNSYDAVGTPDDYLKYLGDNDA